MRAGWRRLILSALATMRSARSARRCARSSCLSFAAGSALILASSTSSETHEWSRWEAGIFSHELRSGLLGPADVNGDGVVTYDEAAAFVEAANAAIDVPKARLRVFFRPPPARKDLPLFDLAPLQGRPGLEVDPEHVGQYYIEDARGVRVAGGGTIDASRRRSAIGVSSMVASPFARDGAPKFSSAIGVQPPLLQTGHWIPPRRPRSVVLGSSSTAKGRRSMRSGLPVTIGRPRSSWEARRCRSLNSGALSFQVCRRC